MFMAFRPMYYELRALRFERKGLKYCRNFDGWIHGGIPDLTLRSWGMVCVMRKSTNYLVSPRVAFSVD
jgi:hypothetical protein